MIDYTPFWRTLRQNGESWYTLTHRHGVNPSTLHRLKHNLPISTVTIDALCTLLHCDVSGILRFRPDPPMAEEWRAVAEDTPVEP